MATKKKTAAAAPVDQRETFVSVSKSMTEGDVPMEEKLRVLYQIQQTDTKIEKIRLLRGELPYEVKDIEDSIEGLKTRIANLTGDIATAESAIAGCRAQIEESNLAIEKYQQQQEKVKNNREFDSLSKEIEFQQLTVTSMTRKIGLNQALLEEKTAALAASRTELETLGNELVAKKEELSVIIEETSKEEEVLNARHEELASRLDPRILSAYDRVRAAAHNHLAVVTVERDACGGCYNKIPPQRQLDINLSKKIIVCEYCGRILVSSKFAQDEE